MLDMCWTSRPNWAWECQLGLAVRMQDAGVSGAGPGPPKSWRRHWTQHPEAVSAKRRCLVQCAIPTIDLKNSFPEFNSSEFHDHKVLALIAYIMKSQLGRLIPGMFKREFGLNNLQLYLCCDLVLKVQQATSLWHECW